MEETSEIVARMEEATREEHDPVAVSLSFSFFTTKGFFTILPQV